MFAATLRSLTASDQSERAPERTEKRNIFARLNPRNRGGNVHEQLENRVVFFPCLKVTGT
jgi:hypothetical protein